MKALRVLLTATVVLTMTGVAFAAKRVELAPGGNTIAGPGTLKIVQGATALLVDGIGGKDVCVTAANTGAGVIDLVMTDDTAGTVNQNVAAGQTLALCQDNADKIEIQCLTTGARGCTADWRVDKK